MNDETFAVTPEYQARVLALMLSNSQFCDLTKEYVTAELFSNKALQWFFVSMTQKSGAHHNSITLKEKLMQAAQAGEIKQEEIPKYIDTFKQITTKMLPDEQQNIRADFNKFVRTQSVKRAIKECLPLIKEGKWTDIEQKISEAVAKGTDLTNLGHSYFDDFQDRFQRRLVTKDTLRIPIGIPELDFKYLNGGLEEKQLGLIVGGTGKGKSIFLSHIAKHTALIGKKVVYYTLELSEDVIAARLDASFAQVPFAQLRDFHEKAFASIQETGQKLGNSLYIKEFPAKRASVNTLRAHYKLLVESGFVPDVVIVDYLDLLASDRSYNELRFELDYITQMLRGMAQEYEVRVWTASQLNRGGYNVENPDATHIAEGFSKMFTVDVALFMAQTQAEGEDDLMRIKIEKNRNGPANREIAITTDYGYMTFYRNVLAKEEPSHENS